ncbi:MAG: hypothetical protein K0R79_414 [Stenotrophomonas indicatrix]|jgi:hypothetical protein|uniref:hypothetical protein n=1 Tax=Stenotrophomonas indicatrix TaxID=2045451 RepID=UPI0024332EA0|nr:hypothetical protein [Stenotrophomonas indicatrix]MDF2480057.1 hypothetical protein [Stenotrophomonas indicatrix]
MKILDFDVPPIAIAWSIPLSFVAGGLVFWILYGAEPGSRADWIAAAGTWVIGIAAAAIAYIAHKRSEKEAVAEEQRRDEAKRVQRMYVAVELADAFGLDSFPADFKALEPSKQTIYELGYMHKRLMRDSERIKLGDQFVLCLTTEIVVEIKSINNAMDGIRALVEVQQEAIARRKDCDEKSLVIKWDLGVVDEIEKQTAIIRGKCEGIFAGLNDD